MQISITYGQLEKIINDLDLFSKIYMGQYNDLMFRITGCISYCNDHPEIKDVLCDLRKAFIPNLERSLYSSLGIWSVDTPLIAKRAFDIQQCLRYQLALHKSNGVTGSTVNFRVPFIHGKWNMSIEDVQHHGEIIANFGIYPHYEKDHFPTYVWNCPVIIIDFHKGSVDIQLSEEANDIILHSQKVADLTYDIKIHDIFKLLYPDVDEAEYSKYTKYIEEYLYAFSASAEVLKDQSLDC